MTMTTTSNENAGQEDEDEDEEQEHHEGHESPHDDGGYIFGSNSTMKAAMVRGHGDASVITIESDVPIPKLVPGHAIVRNVFAGLNFIDTYFRSGLYKPKALPFVLGQEGGGTVVAIDRGGGEGEKDGKDGDDGGDGDDDDGDDDDTVRVGDTVVYLSPHSGSYAEYSLVPLDMVVKLRRRPASAATDAIDMPTALACLTQGLTAHYLVTDAHANLIQKGGWCLIYSVGSGTCQWAAQMAKWVMGYKVIGTTSASKVDVALDLGCCDELIVLDEAGGGGAGEIPMASYSDYASVDVVSRVMQITHGRGVSMILDGIGASTFDISLRCLSPRGILVSFGNASGPAPPFSVLALSSKSAYITRPKLAEYVPNRRTLLRRIDDVFGWIRSGKLKVRIDAMFDLESASEGHEYLESGKSRGKVLFKI